MITITETLYKKMPDDIKACFNQLPNPSSEEVRECFPDTKPAISRTTNKTLGVTNFKAGEAGEVYNDGGGNASRFFKSIIYQAKSSKSDRNSGGIVKNIHPTCKPTLLMSYLIKMVTPKGGVVLDPFAGSGSTLVAAKQNGFDYIGIEMEAEYVEIINKRLANTTCLVKSML